MSFKNNMDKNIYLKIKYLNNLPRKFHMIVNKTKNQNSTVKLVITIKLAHV